MHAYKVLSGGRSAFTGRPWPLPAAGAPGEWVAADGPPVLCVNGIHASTVDQLPQWLGDELWEIELDGEVLRAEPAVVAARARLVKLVSEWDPAARLAFCRDCAGRAARMVAGTRAGAEIYTRTVEPFAEHGLAAAVGYWTAVLAGERATGRRSGPDYDAAFARERAAQAAWLRGELPLRG